MTISDEMTDTGIRPVMDPRMWQRRVEVTRANGQRRLRLFIAFLVVCVLAVAGVIAIHSPLFAAKHVRVTGAVHTPTQAITDAAGLSTHPPLVDINAVVAEQKVERLPWILRASVAVAWPDSVTIEVTERKPVAGLEVSGSANRTGTDDSRSWALVDDSGRILGYVSSLPAGLLPVDVPLEAGSPGTQLPVVDQWGIDVAGSIPTALSGRVKSIDVSSASASGDGTAGAGTVTLALTGQMTAVLGPPVELAAKYEALESMFDSASLQTGDVIDVTVPEEPTISSQSTSR